jgi:hypothetical protein
MFDGRIQPKSQRPFVEGKLPEKGRAYKPWRSIGAAVIARNAGAAQAKAKKKPGRRPPRSVESQINLAATRATELGHRIGFHPGGTKPQRLSQFLRFQRVH